MRRVVLGLSVLLICTFGCGGHRRLSSGPSTPSATGPSAAPLQPALRCNAQGPVYVVPPAGPLVAVPTPPPKLPPPAAGPQPADARIPIAGEAWSRYSPEDQALLRSGGFRVGLDELAVYVARGKPEIYWGTVIQGQSCHAMLYGIGADPRAVDLAVYTCNGTVAHVQPLQPALPCDRIETVAPRMVERIAYFGTQTLDRQWQLVQGEVTRGQSSQDLYVAFGNPYRQGTEAREDKTNATKLVYLDSSGEAYGLNVTLVDDHVVAWTIPAERVLTPEAQQRHMQAMSQAAARQAAAEADARAQQRYTEEQRRQSELQAQQARQAAQQAATTAAVSTLMGLAGSAGSGGGGQTINLQSSSKQTSGEKTLTINGCKYTDGPNGALGNSCSMKEGCPAGYSCHILDNSSIGMCAPLNQKCGR